MSYALHSGQHLIVMPSRLLSEEQFQTLAASTRPRGKLRTCRRDYIARLGVPLREMEKVVGETVVGGRMEGQRGG